ncbi:MAG: retropepsin-like aspartic protease, partial [Candidatus Competibacterales bacterium]|nr:retropepsin-like aspartic protease [Candidatus Competibacterales bacterium]
MNTFRTALGFLLPLVLGPILIAQAEERLTLKFESEPLAKALDRVGELSGIEFLLEPGVDGRVTLALQDAPPVDAVRQLLDGYDYLVLHDSSPEGGQRLRQVRVLARRAPMEPTETAATTIDLSSSQPQLTLSRHGNQPYTLSGTINDWPVDFLVDTGATTVALSARLARR